uniref:Uncharacterized protein n=1 Tax=Arundo donax TaxID=35708 RepID=A0A0A9GWE9_ARUDO
MKMLLVNQLMLHQLSQLQKNCYLS